MNLTELRDVSYAVAKSKGWHDEDAPRATFGDRIALMISELSEALEEYRRGIPPTRIYFKDATGLRCDDPSAGFLGRLPLIEHAAAGNKPEGIGIELADVVIRIGDAAGAHGLDLEQDPEPKTIAEMQKMVLPTAAWSATRHAKPDSFGEWLCLAAGYLLNADTCWNREARGATEEALYDAIRVIAFWSWTLGIDLQHCIDVKTTFNKTRTHRHGNKLL